jgi:ribulose-phosphate 3-epimerase
MDYLPSLACANQLNLESDLRELEALGFSRIHYDIMDGHYVKNLSLNLDTARQLRARFPEIVLDVHLMADEPEQYMEPFAETGAEYLTFHPGVSSSPRDLLRKIKSLRIKTGLALNPTEPAGLLEPYFDLTDLVLVMSIVPGFPGTRFNTETYDKIDELVKIRNERELDFKISVDGGITPEIARKLETHKADMLVLGYLLLFNQPDGITGAWNRFIREGR